eukprot:1140430-Pelagomonas_calceolata.AAC.3
MHLLLQRSLAQLMTEHVTSDLSDLLVLFLPVPQMWEVEKTKNGSKLLVEWGDETDNFDPVTQVVEAPRFCRLIPATSAMACHARSVKMKFLQNFPLLAPDLT